MAKHILILLCGWLLMVPSGGLPPSQWKQMGAYDTARECQDGQATWAKGFQGKGDEEKLKAILFDWRCVPAEAVYPAAKSQKPSAGSR